MTSLRQNHGKQIYVDESGNCALLRVGSHRSVSSTSLPISFRVGTTELPPPSPKDPVVRRRQKFASRCPLFHVAWPDFQSSLSLHRSRSRTNPYSDVELPRPPRPPIERMIHDGHLVEFVKKERDRNNKRKDDGERTKERESPKKDTPGNKRGYIHMIVRGPTDGNSHRARRSFIRAANSWFEVGFEVGEMNNSPNI